MPPQNLPEGTDGSDHFYREIIAARYKRMARSRRHVPYLLMGTIIMATVKVAFSTFSWLEGRMPDMYIIFQACMTLSMVFLFYYGNIGGPRETLKFLKLYSVSCMVLFMQFLLTAYQYYMLWPQEGMISSLLVRYAERTGDYDPQWVKVNTSNAEVVIDVLMGVASLYNALNIHGLVTHKMEQRTAVVKDEDVKAIMADDKKEKKKDK